MTSGLTGSTYEEKLAEVGLMSLSDRRARGDMIETWKIINEKNHWPDSNILKCSSDRSTRITRGSANQALVKDTSSLALRSNFFSNRVVNPWNALPANVRSASSVEAFKAAYDKSVLGLNRIPVM